jgi:hypothetical protein
VTLPAVKAAKQGLYDRLPRARITDVLLDVDAWTRLSNRFTHQRTGRVCNDRAALLTCVLADGINLGLTRMPETCRGANQAFRTRVQFGRWPLSSQLSMDMRNGWALCANKTHYAVFGSS